MMKKNYVLPLMEAIELEIQTNVLTITSVKSGDGPGYGGSSSNDPGGGNAHAPRFGSWDGSEEDEDEFDD